ncbi:MAG TPA: kelch repeat-containing protein, partial [Myxococcota bacterium]|nr:kelch repeat-containing protein [Myxococcota bacterium]
MTLTSVRPWLGAGLALLAFACGPQDTLEAGGLSLGFAARALDGPCPEQPVADPAPPALTRLEYWLFKADGTLHHHGGGSVRAGAAPSFGGIPEGEHLRLQVVATASDGSAWAGGAQDLQIQEGRATHTDVFMSPSIDMACVTRPLGRARAFSAIAPLGQEQVLLAGGGTELRADSCGAGCVELFASRSAERFDPGLGFMLPAAPMHSARLLASATRLPDGAVLVVGGASRVRLRSGAGFPFEIDPTELVPSFEVYLPGEDAWIEKPLPGGQGRVFHSAVALPDGRVLVTGGGTSIAAALADGLLFDPALESVGDFIALADGLDAARLGHTSLVVGNQVMLLGGVTLPTKSPV